MQSVEGMKVLCFELMEASGGRASASTLADLAASANELVIELTRRVHQASNCFVSILFAAFAHVLPDRTVIQSSSETLEFLLKW